MKKRQISIEVEKDDNKTITTTTSMYGASYKKKSSISHTFTNYKPEYYFDEIFSKKKKNDPLMYSNDEIEEFKEIIFDWLKGNNLPTEAPDSDDYSCDLDALSQHLRKEEHLKGLWEASDCLRSISRFKRFFRQENYKECMSYAIELITNYHLFRYSLLEGTISLGQSKQDGLINRNTKLSEKQYESCFKYFESLENTEDNTRQLLIREKWEKTITFANEKFGTKISKKSLTTNYKQWQHA